MRNNHSSLSGFQVSGEKERIDKIIYIAKIIKLEMNRISDCIKGSSFIVLLSFLVLIFYLGTMMEKETFTTRFLDPAKIYAQEKE
jgi:hypothetical protein